MSDRNDTGKPLWTHVIGIGASAGGLDPLETFLQNVSEQLPVAYVIVQHLSPNYKSLMPELLSRRTQLPVRVADPRTRLEPRTVYLTPPKKNAIMRDGELHLVDQDLSPGHALPFPINTFFESLAAALGERSIGIVLSGTGTDGTNGVRAIHEAGGLVMVQDPATAQFNGMPHSAIATGVASYVRSPEQLAESVESYVSQDGAGGKTGLADRTADLELLPEVLSMLGSEDGIDFSRYRKSTIVRRIERRMFVTGHRTLQSYLELLTDSDAERVALRHDLLINVTRFFRDPAAWEHLRDQILPGLLEHGSPSEPLRFWVAACSTGEEVYSLAIELVETMETLHITRPLKIFATDVSHEVIERAGLGVYPESIITDVPARRLSRFFTRKEDGFQIDPRLRKMVVFAQHDLTRDAPFGHMHLVSCRNVLIYMQPALQRQVLSNLHYALRSGGVMFLGSAESLGELSTEFDVVGPRWKTFRKRRDTLMPLGPRSIGMPRLVDPSEAPRGRSRETQNEMALVSRAFEGQLATSQTTYLVVSTTGELMYVFGRGEGLLRVPSGKPTVELAKVLHPDLVLPVTTAMQRARKTRDVVSYGHVVLTGISDRTVNVEVRYQDDDNHTVPFVGVSLRQVDIGEMERPADFDPETAAAQQITELQQELQLTRENLQATIEELETANEEQQSSNEELLASNEELQSTNEELQSVNEELHTVNAEYEQRIRELVDLNNDIDNLLQCTDLATIFLDADLRIRKFTSATSKIFHFEEQDVGRKISDLSHNLRYDRLHEDLVEVLETEATLERALVTTDGLHLLGRFHPYTTGEDEAEGVVVLFIDVSKMRQVQVELLDAVNEMERLYRDGVPPRPPAEEDLRLLLVDPTPETTEDVRRSLTSLGERCVVERARTAEEVRGKLDEEAFDLLLLDESSAPDYRDLLRNRPEQSFVVLESDAEVEAAAPPEDDDHLALIARTVQRWRAEQTLRRRLSELRDHIDDAGSSDRIRLSDS